MVAIIIVGAADSSISGIESILKNKKDAVASRVGSGSAALEKISSKPVDLVIVDENLPDMTGLEFARKLVTINPLVNCALISSLSPEDYHEASEGLGILMQLPPTPGKDEMEKLIKHLNNIINPGAV